MANVEAERYAADHWTSTGVGAWYDDDILNAYRKQYLFGNFPNSELSLILLGYIYIRQSITYNISNLNFLLILSYYIIVFWWSAIESTGWLKKVSHFHELSLNRIKTRY